MILKGKTRNDKSHIQRELVSSLKNLGCFSCPGVCFKKGQNFVVASARTGTGIPPFSIPPGTENRLHRSRVKMMARQGDYSPPRKAKEGKEGRAKKYSKSIA